MATAAAARGCWREAGGRPRAWAVVPAELQGAEIRPAPTNSGTGARDRHPCGTCGAAPPLAASPARMCRTCRRIGYPARGGSPVRGRMPVKLEGSGPPCGRRGGPLPPVPEFVGAGRLALILLPALPDLRARAVRGKGGFLRGRGRAGRGAAGIKAGAAPGAWRMGAARRERASGQAAPGTLSSISLHPPRGEERGASPRHDPRARGAASLRRAAVMPHLHSVPVSSRSPAVAPGRGRRPWAWPGDGFSGRWWRL